MVQCAGCIVLIEIKMQNAINMSSFKYLQASPLLRATNVQQVQWMLLAHIFPLKRLVVCKIAYFFLFSGGEHGMWFGLFCPPLQSPPTLAITR